MKFPERIISQLNEPDIYKDISKPERLHIIRRKGDGQYLTILGSHHDTNAERPYYGDAFFCFEDWEAATFDKPRLIIAEGEQELWGVGRTLRHSIENHYSEVGWQCYLADSYDIPIISGEPPNYSELTQLVEDGYPLNELLLYYGIREIPVWHRMEGDKEDFDSYMERVFAIYKRKLGKLALTHSLPDLGFSYSAFLESYKNHFNDLPDPESAEMNELYLKYTSALNDESFAEQAIARVAKRIMNLRDAHIGATYERYWKEKVSIFSWYGMNHTLALAKYLQDFGSRMEVPRDLAKGFSFQDGHIHLEHAHSVGPDVVEFYVRETAKKRWEEKTPQWPHWLRHPEAPPSSPEDAAGIKAHFQERVMLPISETSYIHYVTHPARQWNTKFFTFFKDLESYAEEYIDPAHRALDQYVPLPQHETHPHEATELAATKRLMWAFLPYCDTLADYRDFAGRVEELHSLIVGLAFVARQERLDATLAYDAITKHVIGLVANIDNIRSANLNATEYLQYILEVLDHIVRSGEPFVLERQSA